MSEMFRFVTSLVSAVLCLAAFFMLRKIRKDSERKNQGK